MAYLVSKADDTHEALQDKLDSIAQQGGRVISVIWEPKRPIIIAGTTIQQDSGGKRRRSCNACLQQR
jgi:hypothetical protein